MSESEPSISPVLGHPCKYIPGFKWYCPLKEQAAGHVSDQPRYLPGVSSAIAFPLELGPRPTWRGSADQFSPYCQA